jgi:GntR family transcriptional regulator, arabinose operon transcriptional repressor
MYSHGSAVIAGRHSPENWTIYMTTLDIKRSSQKALYLQIADGLRKQIVAGELQLGDRLPSVKALSGELGVNPLTVSRAVRSLVDEGLLSSAPGRGTSVTKKSMAGSQIAIIMPNLHSGKVWDDAVKGLKTALTPHDIDLRIFSSHDNPEEEATTLERVKREGFDAVILSTIGGLKPLHLITGMALSGVPVILLDRWYEEVPLWCVGSDHRLGGKLAAQRFLAQGRKRFACCYEPYCATTLERMRGFHETAYAGNPKPGIVRFEERENRDYDPRTCHATRKLLETGEHPDAIFYTNDYYALSGIQEIRRAGLRIPDDIAVIGFDDIDAASVSDPPLTTICQNRFDIGKAAGEILIEKWETPPEKHDEYRRVSVPVHLVERSSC